MGKIHHPTQKFFGFPFGWINCLATQRNLGYMGEGLLDKVLIRERFCPRSNPLPFYKLFLTKKPALSIPSTDKWLKQGVLVLFHFQRARLFETSELETL